MTTDPIPFARPAFWGREREYVDEALASTWVSGGPFVERFEEGLASALKVPEVVVVSNGTTAIHLAFLALDIRPGDEVIVPGFCFLAAANVALHMGAVPVFAEVDEASWCLDPTDVERRITPRTRAIVPVHTYGNVCDMSALSAVADARDVPVVEDAAEALGSSHRGRPAGTTGLMGTFSFQATKTITTGEGGAVATADPALAERMRLYRSHGMSTTRYMHDVPGHNFRLTNLQAALGCAQLEELDRIEAERRRVHRRYLEGLSGRDGVRPQGFDPEVDPVLWAFAVRLDEDLFPQGRDGVMRELARHGIETRPGFYPASAMDIYSVGPLPVSEAVGRSVLVLPTFPTLTDAEIDRVCHRLLELRA
ncbi:MAG TPA: DegT/DnrJ/EryC1/StrS family aminotransferase [Longimicrobiales bacterium]|nr:DegT/DnrJ/EryC1/StrS family aminotransferase [Longimicrobiales bacterium]